MRRKEASDTWAHFGKEYGSWVAISGTPFVIAALYLGGSALVVGWFCCAVGFVFLSCIMTLLWVVTVYPLLLVVGWMARRTEMRRSREDPDGAGTVV